MSATVTLIVACVAARLSNVDCARDVVAKRTTNVQVSFWSAIPSRRGDLRDERGSSQTTFVMLPLPRRGDLP